MDEHTNVITLGSENPEDTCPTTPELEQELSQQFRGKTGIPLYWIVIAMLLATIAINIFQMYQYKQYCQAVTEEAYVVSVSINLLEDSLLFNYGIFPEEIGLGDLREAWISNPCYDTAMNYYQSLFEVYEHFEENAEPSQAFNFVLL